MNPELIDRIYESSFVPELWPDVLEELGKIAEGTGGSLFIGKADLQYWTASLDNRETAKTFVNGRWFSRGQVAARLFGARHAGFLTDFDLFSPHELDLEPLWRDMLRPLGIGWRYSDTNPDRRECCSRCNATDRTGTCRAPRCPKTQRTASSSRP